MSLFNKLISLFTGKKAQEKSQIKKQGAKPQHQSVNHPPRQKNGKQAHHGGGAGHPPAKTGKQHGRDFSRNGDRFENSRRERVKTRPRPKQQVVERKPLPPSDWTIDKFQVEPVEGKKRFHDFDLPTELMHGIADLGFKYCTPIQAASLEKAMAGENVAGRAQTGTGKTAAFLVAILTRYLRTSDRRACATATPRALVIAPTRELCIQICADAQAIGKYCQLRSMAVYGGMDYSRQIRELNEGPLDLLAATPGRLLDFVKQRALDLSKIDTLVIDEADRMLDMGFIPDVRRIIRALPVKRQTLLYSATLNDDVMRLASSWMENPVRIDIEPEQTANANIEQKVLIVTSKQKFTVLCNLLKEHKDERVLVFGNRRSSTDILADKLKKRGFKCELLSGEVSQGQRMRVLENFKSGDTRLVVATDVAGRGLHIADIGLVVNYELPYEAEDYVHRIGRTGRAGKVGVAVSFADEDESFVIPDIEDYLGEALKTTMLQDDDPLLKE